VIVSGRAGFEAARAHSVSWWLAQAALTAAGAVLLPDVDAVPVGRSLVVHIAVATAPWFVVAIIIVFEVGCS
jgi:transposase